MLRKLLIAVVIPALGFLMACSDDLVGPDDDTPPPSDATGSSTKVVITDEDVDGEVTWKAENTYILDGFVFVEEDEQLTIEPGTVVKGRSGTGENASALVVARGGTIQAKGEKDNPIIFTAESDDVSDPDDLPANARGLWGGVIMLGRAPINEPGGEASIEGIPETETRGIYGGSDPADNSGTFRYVSIRHGGSNIGAGNEINGLTFGGVGAGTTVEYVEVYNNQDDGFEWFGGTVETKYLVSALNGDDSFDYDQGFNGKGQFWFTVLPAAQNQGGHGGEHDGGDTQKDATPYATPEIYNVTYIGGGADNAGGDQALKIRENAGGHYINSIFTEFGSTSAAITVEDVESGEDSRSRLAAGDLTLTNNLWFEFGAGSTIDEIAPQAYVADYLKDEANSNWVEDPQLRTVVRSVGSIDPRPASGSPALEANRVKTVPSGDFFEQTNYLGAFGSTNWLEGWTFLSSGQ